MPIDFWFCAIEQVHDELKNFAACWHWPHSFTVPKAVEVTGRFTLKTFSSGLSFSDTLTLVHLPSDSWRTVGCLSIGCWPRFRCTNLSSSTVCVQNFVFRHAASGIERFIFESYSVFHRSIWNCSGSNLGQSSFFHAAQDIIVVSETESILCLKGYSLIFTVMNYRSRALTCCAIWVPCECVLVKHLPDMFLVLTYLSEFYRFVFWQKASLCPNFPHFEHFCCRYGQSWWKWKSS